MLPAATSVTVTAVPPLVTVKAAAGGRLADCRSSENASWMVFPSARTTALVSEGGMTNTWKTAESPYRGRGVAAAAERSPFRGLWSGLLELGPPTRTKDSPSARESPDEKNSVPSWSQPVKG